MRQLLPLVLIPLATAATLAPKPVKWSVGASVVGVAPGTVAHIVLNADIERGWHLYSLTQKAGGPVPLRIQVTQAPGLSLAAGIDGPKPKKEFDKNFGLATEKYSGKARFVIPILASATARPGPRQLTVSARFQACSETLCHPARTERMKVVMNVQQPR
ncbi:MAG TPA: protein-disulfide reductase DsbD N-terminal domain-containing protein [Gemmatimonadaceae bacterium]|nr:protein-disulfide reductase DsbD N-terminal domain-containing protein [Gemmatimonadaceae bacterium]